MPLFTSIGLALGAGATATSAAVVGAAVVGAAAAGIGTVASAVMANQANQAQKGAMGEQKRAQEQAVRDAQVQQRRSEMAQNAANKRTPNVGAIMQQQGSGVATGGGSTMLTGNTGVDPNALALGRSTLLGG